LEKALTGVRIQGVAGNYEISPKIGVVYIKPVFSPAFTVKKIARELMQPKCIVIGVLYRSA